MLAMFRPQRIGLYTIIELYLLISTGLALQNVKELKKQFPNNYLVKLAKYICYNYALKLERNQKQSHRL